MESDSDDGACEVVISNEIQLLDPRVRASAEAIRSLLHEDFSEFGASGRVWDKTSIVPAVTADPGTGSPVTDMMAVRLAPDVVLLTYRIARPGGRSLRSSVWRQDRPAGGSSSTRAPPSPECDAVPTGWFHGFRDRVPGQAGHQNDSTT